MFGQAIEREQRRMRSFERFMPEPVKPPTAFLRAENVDLILYELGNFIDGRRSISDIRDAVSAELGPLPIPSVTDYFDRLAKARAITIQ